MIPIRSLEGRQLFGQGVLKYRSALEGMAIVAMAALAFVALSHLLSEVHPKDVALAFHEQGYTQFAGAIALTVVSYFMLTLYDVLSLRIIGKPLLYRTAALASLTSYALSNNFGFALLTGGSARYRIYSAAGLETADIVRVIATASVTFWTGITLVAAAALVAHPASFTLGTLSLAPDVQRGAGAVILLSAAILIVRLRKGERTFRLFRWTLPRPTAAQAVGQVAIACLDLAAASGALLVLVPGASLHEFPPFFLAYALAIVVALVSHVPGGVGVFEAVMVAALPDIGQPSLLAALIMYRIIYYLLPLVLAAILLGLHERRQLRQPVIAAMEAGQSVLRGVAPPFLAALTFLGGCVLMISGALPAIPERLHFLRHIVPLPFVEASHIAASLVGTFLILLAPGLYRRLDGSFLVCRALLLVGAAFSLAKGFDFEEAVLLLAIAGLLQMARPAFYRRTVLTAKIGSQSTAVAALVAVVLSVWVGFFSYKHVAYSHDLWWQFAWNGDAPRFMRASFTVAIVLISAAMFHMFRGSEQTADTDAAENGVPATALAHAKRTDAMLAWTGDKRFLRSPSGNAMLMYQVQGKSWIVMGDPVGENKEWPDLLWRIREKADTAQGRLLLYEISLACVPLAIDLGLQLAKYGEEARVMLDGFTLEGPERRSLRHSESRAIRDGALFEIVKAADIPSIVQELRDVSEAWLGLKGQHEKAFSVGRFDPAYLARFNCAVVRKKGQIVAFANIWATADHEELSIDLMRHAATMSYGTMDFLFVQLMKWGRANGFRWFSLGIAPLSGLESRRLAPVWARAGSLLYHHGEALYDFEGLRAYKDKFQPVWEPRFIAGPHGVSFLRALVDLQTLIGGGARSAASRDRRMTVPSFAPSQLALSARE